MTDYSRTRRNTEESENFFCRFTFGQFFALLVLEVFTLFFVFYLGARYGREFLGLDKQTQVTVVGSQTPESTAKVTTTDDPEAQKIAKDLIEKANTPELKERIAEMLGKDQPAQVPSVDKPKPVEPERALESPTGSRAMPMRPPPDAGEEMAAGAIRIKSTENAKYSIQVGSYQQMSEANEMVEHWKGRGYPAFMMIADIPNRGRWYRVRVGGFATREDASRYLAKLRVKENVSDALIVLNEQ